MEFWSPSERLPPNQGALENAEYISVKLKLKYLLNLSGIQSFIQEADFCLYQHLVNIMLPDVLKPVPNLLTQQIRNFSKQLENWIMSAVSSQDTIIKSIKV